jgi:hypothetical protein
MLQHHFFYPSPFILRLAFLLWNKKKKEEREVYEAAARPGQTQILIIETPY